MMDYKLQHIFIFFIYTVSCYDALAETKGFILTAPSRLGSEEAICISFKNNTSPEKVSITLLEHKADVKITSVEQVVNGSYECFTIRVPPRAPHLPPLARLLVRISSVYGDSPDVLNAVSTVGLVPEPWLTFISTDKPVYRSNDIIKIRIFSVNNDFRPLLDKVEKVWVENPQHIHIAQWTDVKPVGGFIDVSLPLASDAFPGSWSVKMVRHGHVQTRVFHVQTHLLPSYKVNLTVPEYMEGDEPASIKVCARYTFGKPVQGNVVITMAVHCVFKFYCNNNKETASVNVTLGLDGCTTTDVIAERADAPVWQLLFINATVEESDTGLHVTEGARVKLLPPGSLGAIRGVFRLTSSKIKPGLPFYGKFELISKNDTWKPDNMTVNLCQSQDEEKWCTTVPVVEKAAIPFVIPPRLPQDKPAERIVLEASWAGADSKVINKQSYLRPWFSPTASFLQIERTEDVPLNCNQDFQVRVQHTLTDESSPVFYVSVKSRGNIQLFKEVSEMKNFASLENLHFERTSSISLGPYESPRIAGFSFGVPVTASFGPSATLLVYSVKRDGEVVADSIILNVGLCFSARASAVWDNEETMPGSPAKLKITSEPNSVCSINAVDNKVYVNSKEMPNLALQVMQELTSKSSRSQGTYLSYDKDKCINDKLTSQSDFSNALTLSQETPSVFVDSLDAFEASGLLVMTDQKVVSRPCSSPVLVEPKNSGPADMGEVTALDLDDQDSNRIPSEDPVISLRSDFPDTWIWDLVHLGDNGVQDVKKNIPDSVTEWTAQVSCLSRDKGLALAEPASIRAFQPFFLDFALPSALKKHELLHLPVTVFNYMDASIPVMLSVEPTDNIHIRSELTQSLCIPSNGKSVHTFRLFGVKIGLTNVSIKAEVDPHAVGECGPVLVDFKVDYVKKSMWVKPEGQVIEEVHSALICGKDLEIRSGPQPDSADWSMKMAASEYVDQTVFSQVRVSGDIFGPALTGVENIIKKPTGCGEQNMMAFASNILLVRYLLHRHPVSVVHGHVTRLLRHIELGYQQQLIFRHQDGSFSAFGPERDAVGSIWLSAFVYRHFNKVEFVNIDEDILQTTRDWLLKQQLENGCFPVEGEVYHWDLKRKTIESGSPLSNTAFVLISLLKGGMSPQNLVVRNALTCIQAPHPQDFYTDLLTAYALSLAGEPREARWRMRELLKASSRSYQTLWWEDEGGTAESSIEMTSYGILSLLSLGGEHFLSSAADAVRWLLQFQNNNGGFLSTQDTVIALEALAEYSKILPRSENSLRITLEFMNENKTFEIDRKNTQLQQSSPLPPFLTNVHFKANGSGCALVQTVLRYNVRRGSSVKSLKLQLRVDTVGSNYDQSVRRVEVCTRTRPGNPQTGMALLEINLPTGYYPDRSSLYRVVSEQKGVKKFEEFEDHVNFYLDELNNHKRCVFFLMKRELCVENPTSVLAKVYDYYNSKYHASIRYQIQQSCNDSIDSWIKPDIESNSKQRSRRDTPSSSSANSNGLFSNFKDLSFDLEAPNQISGRFETYAKPPPTAKGSRKCPQCQSAIPDIFMKLYCSSQLSAKVRFLGKHLMMTLEDWSPSSNGTTLGRAVSYTMKRRCSCELVEEDGAVAFLLVTPPRTFNLRSILVVHLDDSITIFPWNKTAPYLETLSSGPACREILTSA